MQGFDGREGGAFRHFREAHAGICQAKDALRSMGVEPGDHPDDAG